MIGLWVQLNSMSSLTLSSQHPYSSSYLWDSSSRLCPPYYIPCLELPAALLSPLSYVFDKDHYLLLPVPLSVLLSSSLPQSVITLFDIFIMWQVVFNQRNAGIECLQTSIRHLHVLWDITTWPFFIGMDYISKMTLLTRHFLMSYSLLLCFFFQYIQLMLWHAFCMFI